MSNISSESTIDVEHRLRDLNNLPRFLLQPPPSLGLLLDIIRCRTFMIMYENPPLLLLLLDVDESLIILI